jgi:O-antigen ligase
MDITLGYRCQDQKFHSEEVKKTKEIWQYEFFMKAIRWFFLLFTISVLISQSAMDFFSILLCGQWAWLVWKSNKAGEKQPLMRKFGLEKTWAIWVLIVIIGFLLNPFEPAYALTRVVEFKWVAILYVLIEVFQVMKPSRRSLNFILGFIFFIGFVNLFLYYADWDVLSSMRYGSEKDGFLRAGGFFTSPMTFAHSFVLFLCFLLGLFLIDQKNWRPKQRLFAVLTLAVASLGLYLTYTRGVWFGFIIALVLGLFFWRPRYSFFCLVIFSLTAGALYLGSTDFRWRMRVTFNEAQGESERKLIWKSHFLIFKENPVFGLGYGQNTRQLPKYYERLNVPKETLVSHAHNQYLHLAAGTGILGLLAYLTMWFYFLLQTWKLWKSNHVDSWDRGVAFGFLLAQGSFLIAGMTEANFEHSKVRFALMLMWAYTIYLAKKYSLLGWKLRGKQ